jgi:hypothetical protein
MHLYVDLVLTWILFLALFPMAFVWFRQVWAIAVKRDFSGVAVKNGESPPNPAKFAPFALAANLIAGTVVLSAIIGVVGANLAKDEWTAMAGITIWCKLFFNFALSRHAHWDKTQAGKAAVKQAKADAKLALQQSKQEDAGAQ